MKKNYVFPIVSLDCCNAYFNTNKRLKQCTCHQQVGGYNPCSVFSLIEMTRKHYNLTKELRNMREINMCQFFVAYLNS